jgi:phage terminase large subunit-like protein
VQVMLDRHPELPIEPITQTKDKFSRFLALGADYEFGRVLHHQTLLNSAFENQLVHIPAARHDDMADAAAMLAAYDNGGAAAVERPKGFV